MTLELVPWRGTTVPVLARGEIARYTTQDYINWITSNQMYVGQPPIQTTYRNRPAEPISYSFQGFVDGMLYSHGPVAAAEAYRLRVFGQAPLLYQEMIDGRAGDLFDDRNLDRIREPWPGATLSDLMKRVLVYGDFAGNAFIVDMDDELVLLRPDWVEIILEKRMHRGVQVGWKQVGIVYYEGGLGVGEGVPFLPGEYCHFVPGLPDPLASYRGMSWLTPLIREVMADKAANQHKLAFFENSATVNLAVSLPKEITPTQFEAFVELMDSKHKGPENAGKTLYTGGGADVTVIGANMQQMDFAAVQGKGETRVANSAGVPPVLLSFSEGMQGSSLNAGNYTAAKRNFVDTTMRDLWQNFSGSVAQMDYFRPPLPKSRLWYDGRDIPFLHEDAKDTADIQSTRGSTINSYIREGWEPESAKAAVLQDDVSLLKHSGALSVQLQAPGAQMDLDQDGAPDDLANLDFGALRAWFSDDEIERRDYLRHDKGTVGGGRFRRLSDIARPLLKDWAKGKGDPDPLKQFNRDQLRRIAKDSGLTLPRGAPEGQIKALLYKNAGGGRASAKKTPAAPQDRTAPAAPSPQTYDEALEAGDREATIDLAHAEMRDKLGRELDDAESDRLERNVDAAIKRREKKNPTPATPPASVTPTTPEPAAPGTEPPAGSRPSQSSESGRPSDSARPASELFDLDDDAVLAEASRAIDGTYGGLQAKVTEGWRDGLGRVVVGGQILGEDGEEVGTFSRILIRLDEGRMSANHESLFLNEDQRGAGFATDFNDNLYAWYRRSGFDEVSLTAGSSVGGYAWATQGFDFADDKVRRGYIAQMRDRVGQLDDEFDELDSGLSRAEFQRQVALFEELASRVEDGTATAYELSQLGRTPGQGRDDWWIGKALMLGSQWKGVKPL